MIKLDDRTDYFNFPSFHLYMATFKQHLYMEYFSKLMQTSRAYASYHDFPQRGLLLTRKLLNQWFLVV